MYVSICCREEMSVSVIARFATPILIINIVQKLLHFIIKNISEGNVESGSALVWYQTAVMDSFPAFFAVTLRVGL